MCCVDRSNIKYRRRWKNPRKKLTIQPSSQLIKGEFCCFCFLSLFLIVSSVYFVCVHLLAHCMAIYTVLYNVVGAGIACWWECQTHDWKALSLNPGRSFWRMFFSRLNFVCWLLVSVCSTPVLPQKHVKDNCHSAKIAGGRLHVNMHTSLTQRSQSRLTMPLSLHSVGTYLETSWHATCQETFSHSNLSPLSHCGLILV